MMEWVLKFNQYDLYSKGHTKPNVKELKPYYDELVCGVFSGEDCLVRKAWQKIEWPPGRSRAAIDVWGRCSCEFSGRFRLPEDLGWDASQVFNFGS